MKDIDSFHIFVEFHTFVLLFNILYLLFLFVDIALCVVFFMTNGSKEFTRDKFRQNIRMHLKNFKKTLILRQPVAGKIYNLSLILKE